MAKSKETFNKKQRETKRQKQLEDKRQRAEERKANKQKDGSLESMMAYVDENGNLSDTPPDPKRMKEINAEDIEIGVPKRPQEEELPRTGVVSFFNKAKGFGFINDTQTGERFFFHISDMLEQVDESDNVQFSAGQSPRGPSAQGVRKLA